MQYVLHDWGSSRELSRRGEAVTKPKSRRGSAEILLTKAATAQSRAATTGMNGAYRISLLPPGSYKVKVSMAGFKTAESFGDD